MPGRFKEFENKNVYIVGGSEGIGLETARLMAGFGAHVLIFSRKKEKLERAVEQIKPCCISGQQKIAFYTLNVTDHEQVEKVMETATREFGNVDILINNAGRAIPDYFENISYQQFDDTMKTNLYGIRNTCAALIPRMKQKGGTIVNVSSLVGITGVFGYTDYAASKFAIIGFSETLRSEFKKYQVKVLVLCPPDTDTPGFAVENIKKPLETKAISGNAKLRSPRFVATAMVKGMTKKKFLILPGFDSKLLHVVKRLFPGIIDWIMDRDIKKSQEKKS